MEQRARKEKGREEELTMVLIICLEIYKKNSGNSYATGEWPPRQHKTTES
jgi:hypothetical protein